MWYSSTWNDGRRHIKVIFNRHCLLIGNTRWHWAIEDKESWNFLHSTPDIAKLESIDKPLLKWAAVGHIPDNDLLHPSNQLSIKDVPLMKLPPWLGIDRALGAWGALRRVRKYNVKSKGFIIADAGTVLSLTKIGSNGEFEGGQLVPGLNLQLAAMAKGTKNLENPWHLQG